MCTFTICSYKICLHSLTRQKQNCKFLCQNKNQIAACSLISINTSSAAALHSAQHEQVWSEPGNYQTGTSTYKWRSKRINDNAGFRACVLKLKTVVVSHTHTDLEVLLVAKYNHIGGNGLLLCVCESRSPFLLLRLLDC